MSAGSLSYSGIVGRGKVTLPSVDTWGTNMNILKNPNSGIYTKRIDKVGETNQITQYIEDATDRACEAINVYARGVNPMVSVSYNNHGSNGGQRSSGLTSQNNTQAKLPYRIMNGGAFRPPVLLQEDLLPLSRQPRNWTNAYAQKGFVDFSRKMRTCGTAAETKEVHTDTLRSCVRPTAVYKMETPLHEPFEVKYVIQPSIKIEASSGLRSMDITEQKVQTPTKEIDVNPLHAHAQATYTDTSRYVNANEFDPDRYLQDTNTHSVNTNVSSSNKNATSIEDILDLSDLPVHDIRTYSAQAPTSGIEQTKYIHDDIELSRRLPEYQATTNIVDNTIRKNISHENTIELGRNMPMTSFTSNTVARGASDHGSRDARLNPKISAGGYDIPSQIPSFDRMQNVHEYQETEKARMNRMVTDSMQSRYSQPAPFANTPHMVTKVY